MKYFYDLFVKYHDEPEERVVGRMLSLDEMLILFNFLLRERKRHFEQKTRNNHYPDYIRVE